MRWYSRSPPSSGAPHPASYRGTRPSARTQSATRASPCFPACAGCSEEKWCSQLPRPIEKSFLGRVLCLAVSLFSVSCLACNSQIIKYKDHAAPGPLSIVPEKGAFFLYGKNTKFYFPFLFFAPAHTSSGTPSSPTIRFKSVSLTKASSNVVSDTIKSESESSLSSNVSPAFLELALLPYGYVRTMFSSASASPFCCSARPSGVGRSHPSFSITTEFLPTNECPYPGALKRYITGDPVPLSDMSPTRSAGARLPSDVSSVALDSSANREYVYPVKLKGTPGSEGQLEMEVEDTGIYFLVTSNCGDFKGLTFDGEVSVRNVYGYLPGYEYPKMPFYFVFMVVYFIVCVVWSCLMYRQRTNLIAFHKFMLVVGILGFLESLALFVYLYDYNLRGERNKVLLVTSILVTVVKSIFSYMLVLLGAIGWSITIPVLQKRTVIKMQIVVVLYIILDTVR
ncbi:membrane protein [Cystoisospora suis]|uniref:Membrane protein n=1 Tax=Cystoisospora suis TaxID=483139 RepID=A0A2C6KML4_9APIC|nr:membrane protein [Cystoisospora suis]